MAKKPAPKRILGIGEVSEWEERHCDDCATQDEADFAAEDETAEAKLGMLDRVGGGASGAVGGASGQADPVPPGAIGSPAPDPNELPPGLGPSHRGPPGGGGGSAL